MDRQYNIITRSFYSLCIQTNENVNIKFHTFSKKEFIHFVKVFFCMASRSSCSALMRPCSNLITSSLCVMTRGGYSCCVRPAGEAIIFACNSSVT